MYFFFCSLLYYFCLLVLIFISTISSVPSRLGLNFTNIFTSGFYACSSQKRKSGQLRLTLLGSTGVKAARKTLMKLALGRQCLIMNDESNEFKSYFFQILLTTFGLLQHLSSTHLQFQRALKQIPKLFRDCATER